MIRFAWKCSYQNEVEYEVYGHEYVRRIEAYRECKFGLLDYQRKSYNGTAEEFERMMVGRQGGIMIRYADRPWRGDADYWAAHQWPQDLYEAFVAWLREVRAKYLVEHEARRQRLGWTHEEFPVIEEEPIPRPMHYNPNTQGYEVEPWFLPEMATWAQKGVSK
jgi:hypothetical protein